MTPQDLSDSMLKRIQVIAQYVIEQQNHDFKIDFADYWDDNWSGKAEANETIEFFASEQFVKDLLIGRKF